MGRGASSLATWKSGIRLRYGWVPLPFFNSSDSCVTSLQPLHYEFSARLRSLDFSLPCLLKGTRGNVMRLRVQEDLHPQRSVQTWRRCSHTDSTSPTNETLRAENSFQNSWKKKAKVYRTGFKRLKISKPEIWDHADMGLSPAHSNPPHSVIYTI